MLTKCKNYLSISLFLEKIYIFQNKPSRKELKYDLDLTKLLSPDKVT
jgi:hypothetical protein